MEQITIDQISMLPPLGEDEDAEDIVRQVNIIAEWDKKKRKWENAFQKWSDEQAQDGTTSLGVCGYGDMCEWCKNNDYGRPCVRALNAMCREKHIRIDYTDFDFTKIW